MILERELKEKQLEVDMDFSISILRNTFIDNGELTRLLEFLFSGFFLLFIPLTHSECLEQLFLMSKFLDSKLIQIISFWVQFGLTFILLDLYSGLT